MIGITSVLAVVTSAAHDMITEAILRCFLQEAPGKGTAMCSVPLAFVTDRDRIEELRAQSHPYCKVHKPEGKG